MGEKFMKESKRKPEITVFAGPNGSGKSTITLESPHVVAPYINADDIKRTIHCGDIVNAHLICPIFAQ